MYSRSLLLILLSASLLTVTCNALVIPSALTSTANNAATNCNNAFNSGVGGAWHTCFNTSMSGSYVEQNGQIMCNIVTDCFTGAGHHMGILGGLFQSPANSNSFPGQAIPIQTIYCLWNNQGVLTLDDTCAQQYPVPNS